MSLIDDGVVQTLRYMNQETLPETVELLEPTNVKAPGGFNTQTYAVVGLAACRVSPFGSTPQEQLRGGKITHPERSWLVVFTEGTEIPETYHLRVFGAEGWTKRLKVVAVAGPRTNGVMTKVVGEEVPDA